MDRKTIEKAAEEYADKQGDFGAGWYHAVEDFAAGAEWRINSVWHDKNEMPEREELVLCEIHFKKQKAYLILQCNADGETDVEIPFWDFDEYKLIRWAYIDDLIPDRKEATHEQ